MTFTESIRTCARDKYITISGRAPRSEFWWFILFIWLGNIVLSIVDGMFFGGLHYGTMHATTGFGGMHEAAWFISRGGPLGMIFRLVMILPVFAVSVRRLHDTDHSGWWLLLGFIPIIGQLILLVFLASRSYPTDNRFGPEPVQVSYNDGI